ncbi:hypothetical protein RQP46_003970 [Phenoliferia psychrophenolica]
MSLVSNRYQPLEDGKAAPVAEGDRDPLIDLPPSYPAYPPQQQLSHSKSSVSLQSLLGSYWRASLDTENKKGTARWKHQTAMLAIPILAAVLQTALLVGSIYVAVHPWVMPYDEHIASWNFDGKITVKEYNVFISLVGAGISAIAGLALAIGAKCHIARELASRGISLEAYETLRKIGESRLPSRASVYALAPAALFLLSNSAAPAIISIWQAGTGQVNVDLQWNFTSIATGHDYRTVIAKQSMPWEYDTLTYEMSENLDDIFETGDLNGITAAVDGNLNIWLTKGISAVLPAGGTDPAFVWNGIYRWLLLLGGQNVSASMVQCMYNDTSSYTGYFFINTTGATPTFFPLASCLTTVVAGVKSGVTYSDEDPYFILEGTPESPLLPSSPTLVQELKQPADATALSLDLVAQMWGDQSQGGRGSASLHQLVSKIDDYHPFSDPHNTTAADTTQRIFTSLTQGMAAMAVSKQLREETFVTVTSSSEYLETTGIPLTGTVTPILFTCTCLRVGPNGWENLYLGVVAAMWLAVLLALVVSLRNPPVSLDPLDPISMLLVAQNSPPSAELEGGCTGDVDRLHSRKVKMRLRAVDSERLGFVEKIAGYLSKGAASSDKKSLLALPDLPDFSSLRQKIDLDLTATLSSLTASLDGVRKSLAAFQEEVSRGPNSTYSRVIAARADTTIHPEMSWDAEVRLGVDIAKEEQDFVRERRRKIVAPFARLVGVEESEVDERDVPVIAMAGSGGGYRAMVNTLGNVAAAKEAGIWDVVSYVSAVSGSCWAMNLFYSIGEADADKTIQHVRERIVTPFLDPSTIEILTGDETKDQLLSGIILKESSKGGEASLVDVYGTLVAARLFVPSSGTVDPLQLKVSSQRDYIDDGSNPLPIYCTIRHEIPELEELEKQSTQSKDGETAKLRKEGADEKARLMTKGSWMWFEFTPYEFGSDELGAWIPTWSLGRLFKNGKNIERQPELSLTILSGIFASAFCATLYSYYKEIKPLVAVLPFFAPVENWLLSNYEHSLDHIHPITPAEIPSFLKDLDGLRPTAPATITKLDTLGLMDAGANLNVPYVPLFRRDVDLILALDASADSHALWFTRAEEYAVAREISTWPQVHSGSLFPDHTDEEARGGPEEASSVVDEAKAQEGEAAATSEGKMPESQPNEPPLGRCNIWIGSTSDEKSTCRNDSPTVEDVMARDGIALAYFPLRGGPGLENVEEVWSTWKFDYTPEETDGLVKLAKSNFNSGEKELATLIRGLWMRKRQRRLDSEAKSGADEP